MSSSIARILNKQVPVWQVLTLFAVVGVGAHLLAHGGCCCAPRHALPPVETANKTETQSQETKPTQTDAQEPAVKEEEHKDEPSSEAAPAEDQDEAWEDEEEDEDDDEWAPFPTDWLFFDGPYPILDTYTVEDGPAKMVLCVNMALKMGKGKIAAQCGHATLGAYKLARKYCKTGLRGWEATGTTKVAVKVEQEDEFAALLEKAKAAGVVCTIVEDAGRTQIAAGSRTVLALGPAPAAVLDQISGHLKLL